jgi:succinate dehydrogenase / fumarate reductase cytochrome b subunit
MEHISKRPVYLNLFKIRLPIGGVVSIFHRVTGVFLVLLLPLATYLLQQSLQSAATFENTVRILGSLPGRALLLIVTWMFVQHLYSGIRHLLMDIDVGIERTTARRSAWLTLAASIVTLLIIGLWMK